MYFDFGNNLRFVWYTRIGEPTLYVRI